MKENFQVNMDSYVFSLIRFLFNIACCSQKQSFNNDVFVDLIFFPHFKIMGMLVANTGFEDIVYQYTNQGFALLVALTVLWLAHITIQYLRLMSHAVYHCAVVIALYWHSGLRVQPVT